MFVQTTIFLLVLSAAFCDDDCDKTHLAPIRLRKNLLCGYDRNTRPVLNYSEAVSVTMKMIVKYYDYDIHMNTLTIDSWLPMFWKDQHLKWNPKDYDSIDRIHLADSDIWMPDISIYNRRDQGGDQSAIGAVTCIVSSNGQVACVPSTQHTSLCVSDFSKYPFDTHNCTIRFGSWVHSGEELNITLPSSAISYGDVVPNGEWILEDTAVNKHPGKFKCCPNNTYPSINFSFKLTRIHGAHTASVVLPGFALILTTLTSLWIAPDNSQRLNLCYVNFISANVYLQYVAWNLPWNGDKIPLILLFARDYLMLSAITILISVILKNMVDNEKPAPEWMSKIVCVLIAFKPGQLAFLSNTPFKGLGDDDASAILNSQDESSRSKEWLIFAKIIDRTLFVIYIIVFVCMFIGFFL